MAVADQRFRIAVRPLKIALISRQLPPRAVGGIGSYVINLAGFLRDAGHHVTIVSAASGCARSSTVTDGICIEQFGSVGPERFWRWALARVPGGGVRLQAALSAFLAIRRLRTRFDVIEAAEWKAEGLLLRLARRGKVVVHLHLANELVLIGNGTAAAHIHLSDRLERLSARLAHGITATTVTTFTRPDGSTWIAPERVRLVPPPIDLRHWTACGAVVDTGPTILFIGHLEKRKAPEVLLAAAGLLAAEVPGLRVHYVGRTFPGPDGRPADEWLLEEASRLGITVDVTAPVTDAAELLAIYGRARVVAVPSRFETLSMVALEAMACARPVVLTHRVGASELVGHDLAEWIVPVGDASRLAAAMRGALLDPEVAAAAGRRARATVERVCAPAAIAQVRVDNYRELISGSGS